MAGRPSNHTDCPYRNRRCHRLLLLALLAFSTPIRTTSAATPNDTHYRALQWNLRAIALQDAWEITTGDANVVVAVIDSGVAPQHPDLEERLLPGFDFISDARLSGDGDGWDDDPTDVLADPDNRTYHGSHVAGIIGATTNNDRGVAGIDWSCRILPVRVISGAQNEGNDADISAAIRWAAGLDVEGAPPNEHPARVINLSFGAKGRSPALVRAVDAAIDAGSIVVAAAGNDGEELQDFYPAMIPRVITVGATTLEGQRAEYSNFGDSVDIMAPGGDLEQWLPNTYLDEKWQTGILSTSYYFARKRYSYRMLDGTSAAAPHVSATIALLLAVDPELDALQARGLLRATSTPVPGCDDGCGAGLLDAKAAVEAASDPDFSVDRVVQYRGSGCELAQRSSAGPCLALVLLLLSLRLRGGRARSLVLALWTLAVFGSCSGTIELVRVDSDTTEPPSADAAPIADQDAAYDVSVDIATGTLPDEPGELCPTDRCGNRLLCIEGICRKRCRQPDPGCNAKASECASDESCLQAASGQDACMPAEAQLGDQCGGEVLCVGGTLCVRLDLSPATCVALAPATSCSAGEDRETTSGGCAICVPRTL
jgi:hypothetical protein